MSRQDLAIEQKVLRGLKHLPNHPQNILMALSGGGWRTAYADSTAQVLVRAMVAAPVLLARPAPGAGG